MSPPKTKWFVLFAMGMAAVTMGCTSKKDPESESAVAEPEFAPPTLKILIVGDPELGARISRQWSARRNGELTIVIQSDEDFSSGNFEIPEEFDVVIYPPIMLGEFVDRNQIMPMPKEIWNSDVFNKREILQRFRTAIVRHADQAWAVPLGGPNFAMLCNRALFERLKIEPAETWDEIEENLKAIATGRTTTDSGEKPGSGIADAKVDMPLAPGWAAATFLARVAPEIRNRGKLSTVFDRATMNPLIDSPPFVEALEQIKSIASQRSVGLKPDDVFRLAVNGQSSIAFSWPAIGFSKLEDPETIDRNDQLEDTLLIRSLPGSGRWFDPRSESWILRKFGEDTKADLIGFSGLIASVPRHAGHDRTAWEFLEWLSSKQISLLTLVQSPTTGPFRATHLGDVSQWTGDQISLSVADQFADVVANAHERPLILVFPQITGSQLYLDALDSGIQDCIAGHKPARESLAAVAAEWDSITDSLGRNKQIQGLRKQSGF